MSEAFGVTELLQRTSAIYFEAAVQGNLACGISAEEALPFWTKFKEVASVGMQALVAELKAQVESTETAEAVEKPVKKARKKKALKKEDDHSAEAPSSEVVNGEAKAAEH